VGAVKTVKKNLHGRRSDKSVGKESTDRKGVQAAAKRGPHYDLEGRKNPTLHGEVRSADWEIKPWESAPRPRDDANGVART